MDHRLEWAGEQNSMSTGFLWRIDWAADSEPNSMTFRLGWRMDHGLGLGRRTKFHDDWISSRMEDSADSDPNLTTTVQVFQWMIDWAADSNPTTLVSIWAFHPSQSSPSKGRIFVKA